MDFNDFKNTIIQRYPKAYDFGEFKIVSLSPGSWEYNQFDNKDPELIRVAISFQPRIVKPWQWYSYHPENDKKHRLGWGITLVEAYREANPD